MKYYKPLQHILKLVLILFINLKMIAEENLQSPLPSPPRKKTICLNMIVKNESHVIKRCLKSVSNFIDYWVIVDTGSTDRTKEIIEEYMKEKRLPGELHQRPWVNFGHNREEALVLAKNHGDYILFIDADDILAYSNDFKLPDLIYDVYLIEVQLKFLRYYLPSFIKADLNWHWHDPVHEYIDAKDAKVGAIIPNIKYIYNHDGARSKDPEVHKKDIQILKECLENDPRNERCLMYLAQTYRSAGEDFEALKYYQKRVDLGGCPEEVFWAMLQIAHIQNDLNYDRTIVKESYNNAHNFRPSRPEPIYNLAHMAKVEGDYQKGYEIAQLGLNLPPSNDISYFESASYDGIIYEFASCAFKLGKYKECLKACDKMIKKNAIPDELVLPIKKLRDSTLKKIREQKALKLVDKFYNKASNKLP